LPQPLDLLGERLVDGVRVQRQPPPDAGVDGVQNLIDRDRLVEETAFGIQIQFPLRNQGA